MKSQVSKTTAIIIWGLAVLAPLGLCQGQTAPTQGWNVLEAGLGQKNASQRVAAVRVLGLLPHDAHAAQLAEQALKDPKPAVRVAAATALGQMQATSAAPQLKEALNDKNLTVVMAAAHALLLINDPACYDVYYGLLTGERKNNSSMIAQEMQVIHDPKQLAAMGFNEGIGNVPFAGMGWEAVQTIMKDRKSGAAAKAALISNLSADPDVRTNAVLVTATQDKNWVLRVAGLEAIAKRGDPALLPDIAKAMGDRKLQVQYTAAAAFVHLSAIPKADRAGTVTNRKRESMIQPSTVQPGQKSSDCLTPAVANGHGAPESC